MTRNEIMDRLQGMMKKSCQVPMDWAKVGDSTAIRELGFDSLSILDLIYDVQQEFGLEFDAEELAGVKTVGALVTFLERKLA